MKSARLLTFTLGSALLLGGTAFAQRWDYAPAASYDGGSEQAFEQRGFQDGVIGADHDFENHRRVDVNNRDEYRDPDFIPRYARGEYREGFRRGYYMRVREIYGDGDRDRRW